MSVIYNEHVTGLHFEKQQQRTKQHKNERKTRNEDNDADGGCIDMCFFMGRPTCELTIVRTYRCEH